MSSQNEQSRRDVFRILGATAAVAGAANAQHEHHHAPAEPKKAAGPYKPRHLTEREYATVRRLSELVIPADERGGSAVEAGAPEFIDTMCHASPEMADIWTGGLAWLDRAMERRHGVGFAAATPDQQTALLDLIAYRKNATPELGAGIQFFSWARKMIADAYYTSPVGVKDIGFVGNVGMPVFKVPQEAVEYALKRSGLA